MDNATVLEAELIIAVEAARLALAALDNEVEKL